MSMLEATLTNLDQRSPVDAVERESLSQSFTLAQSIARVMLTIGLMAGMSALFASQIYATLR